MRWVWGGTITLRANTRIHFWKRTGLHKKKKSYQFPYSWQVWCFISLTISLWRKRKVDLCELGAMLVYMVSHPGLCNESLSQNKYTKFLTGGDEISLYKSVRERWNHLYNNLQNTLWELGSKAPSKEGKQVSGEGLLFVNVLQGHLQFTFLLTSSFILFPDAKRFGIPNLSVQLIM